MQTLAAEVFAWLKQIAADHDVRPVAFKVAFIISQHVNEKTRSAWPAMTRIADQTGGDLRHVRRSIGRLVERGHLKLKQKGGGRGRSAEYEMLLKRGAESPVFSNPNGGAKAPLSNSKQGPLEQEKRAFETPKSGSKSPPNYLKEPSKEPMRAGAHQESSFDLKEWTLGDSTASKVVSSIRAKVMARGSASDREVQLLGVIACSNGVSEITRRDAAGVVDSVAKDVDR